MIFEPQPFSGQLFFSPPSLFAPVYTWVWNEPITRAGIDSQLDSMADRNIRSVYVLPEPKHFRPSSMITSLEPEYLSDDFFQLIAYTAQAAKKRGIALWLYDEGGWPSGSACGQVVCSDPALAQKIIRQEKITLKAGDILSPGSDVLAAFTVGLCRVKLPYSANTDTELLLYRIARQNGPDLFNPQAAETFIRLTHEGYKKAIDGKVPEHFLAAFTDEPSVHYPAFLDPGEFRLKYGYNLYDMLPALFDHDMGEKGIRVQIDFCDCYSSVVAENYYEKLRAWCAENGIASSGHLNGEDNFLTVRTHGGHLMRHLRCFDIPGVDAIWRQIFPGGENSFFPRLASSAAAQNGSALAVSESFAVYGAGLTYDQMRYILHFQAVRGINLFNFMVISYGNSGFTASQERPCFQPEMPGSGDIAPFNDFTARLSYISAVGYASHRAALYYPIRDIWAGGEAASAAAASFERIGRGLERLQAGFDIIDDDALCAASLKSGCLCIGSAVYNTVYLPECKYIPGDVRAKLLEFESQNGHIYTNIAAAEPFVSLYPPSGAIRVSKRETEDGERIYMIFNEETAAAETTVFFDEDLPAYELDPTTGYIYDSDNKVKISLRCGESRIFVFTLKNPETVIRRIPGEVFAVIDAFKARRLRRFVLTDDGIRSIAIDEPMRDLPPGDWKAAFGADFSGDVLYEASIQCNGNGFILDLGEVNYTCEAFLDGVSLGIRCMPPYTYYVPASERPLGSHETLTIRVSNTAANEYVTNQADKMFSAAQIGPYHARTLKFEKESQGGGLLGPVTMRRVIQKKEQDQQCSQTKN